MGEGLLQKTGASAPSVTLQLKVRSKESSWPIGERETLRRTEEPPKLSSPRSPATVASLGSLRI